MVQVTLAGRVDLPWQSPHIYEWRHNASALTRSILRTTPAVLSLFSIVVMLANQMQTQHPFDLPNPAWSQKSLPIFADAIAKLRQQLWQFRLFQVSDPDTDTVNLPLAFFNCWSDLLCYAV